MYLAEGLPTATRIAKSHKPTRKPKLARVWLPQRTDEEKNYEGTTPMVGIEQSVTEYNAKRNLDPPLLALQSA
jgi:hypothetical protein